MSLHSPNQYVGPGRKSTRQGGYCPTTLDPPGAPWCFGVSGSGKFERDPTEDYHTYAMRWEPDGVDYYMDGVFMNALTAASGSTPVPHAHQVHSFVGTASPPTRPCSTSRARIGL